MCAGAESITSTNSSFLMKKDLFLLFHTFSVQSFIISLVIHPESLALTSMLFGNFSFGTLLSLKITIGVSLSPSAATARTKEPFFVSLSKMKKFLKIRCHLKLYTFMQATGMIKLRGGIFVQRVFWFFF